MISSHDVIDSDNVMHLVKLLSDQDPLSALENASATGFFGQYPYLINSKHPDAKNYASFLHFAVEESSFEVVKFMLDQGADPGYMDEYSQKAIDYAIEKSFYDKVALLLITSLKKNALSDMPLTPKQIIDELLDLTLVGEKIKLRKKICEELFSASFPYQFDFNLSSLFDVLERESKAIQHDEIICSYSESDLLGKGKYCKVYKAIKDSSFVAIKLCKTMTDEGVTRREAKVYSNFDHPNIVKYICRIESVNYFGMVLEHCNGIDLDKIIISQENPLSLLRQLFPFIVTQINSGLGYLHDSGFVHLDLKPANILTHRNDNGETRFLLADFGTTAKKGEKKAGAVTTYMFSSPQRFDDAQAFDFADDIYSFGVIMWCVETKNSSWHSNNHRKDIYHRLVTLNQSFFKPADMRKTVGELVEACCDHQPEKRPNCNEINSYIVKNF